MLSSSALGECPIHQALPLLCSVESRFRYSEAKEALGSVLDQEVLDKCSPLWGLNDEGELLGVHREIGPRGLWSMMGQSVAVGPAMGILRF